jgi:glycerophosphoryl diester phosphodiesterase
LTGADIASQPTRFPFLDHPRPLAIAHRGGALEAEENTPAAFAHAAALGFRFIETDVQASSDGVAVVFHDAELARMTGERGRIGDRTFAELGQVRTHGGEQIAALEDMLAAFPEMRFNIEPKSDVALAPLAQAIRRCGAIDRVCVGCFDVRRTMRMRELLGERLCWSPSYRGVLKVWLAGWGLPVPACEFPVLQIPRSSNGIPIATPRLVAAAHARGIQVHVWTIDEEREMERLLDIGVDGLMSDRPSVLKAVLERRGQWHGGGAGV